MISVFFFFQWNLNYKKVSPTITVDTKWLNESKWVKVNSQSWLNNHELRIVVGHIFR